MANPHVDLSALTVQRQPAPDLRSPRRWISRVIVPTLLLTGFAGLFVYASWDRLASATPVTVIPVLARAGTSESAGQELFKANGWIEPRPLATDVPVQTEGMYRVTEVLVALGDRVSAGQVLAKMDDERAKLDYLAMQRRLEKRRAATRAAKADLARAEVTQRNSESSVVLAGQEGDAEVKSLEADVAKARAQEKSAELEEEALKQSGILATGARLNQAKQQREVAAAETKATLAKVEKARVMATVRVRTAELSRAAAAADVASLKAKADEAEHEVADADVEVRKAQLELDRTQIKAPIDGVVMQLNIRVGSIMGGKNTAIEHKDAAVTLYDPAKLQVRVEVPIAKFNLVKLGQPAVVELEDVLPGVKMDGKVMSDTHFANVARNSVPVKVAIPDQPPGPLRPEMIASVRFLSAQGTDARKAQAVQRLIVPRRLIVADADQRRVWVVDSNSRAALKVIELVPGPQVGEMVEVVSGLQATDKLIASGKEQLAPGQRVRIVGEQ